MLDSFIAHLWNRFAARSVKPVRAGLQLGRAIVDGQVRHEIFLPDNKRSEHISILGKTGQGKSYLLRTMAGQDVWSRRGFVLFDLHGDLSSYLLALVASEERRTGEELSDRLILIDPGDSEYSVGLNVLEPGMQNTFVQLGEFTQILKQRWHLDSFGARTEELLRNSLYVLTDNGFTLVEMTALLTDAGFRASCLARVSNPEVADYFRYRFESASDAMHAVMREPILNKLSAFTADPRFRHLVGQQRSTFSVADAMNRAQWVVLHLNKGRLGDQAVTLGALFMTKLKNALFARQKRSLFTLYCDEIQNLVGIDGAALETMLSEARKFGVSVVSANQFLAQFPASMQAAMQAVGTHICFQLSSSDADKMGAALGGGKRLSELLKNLPKRHFVFKGGPGTLQEIVASEIAEVPAEFSDLYRRVRARWARPRAQVEQEIRSRLQAVGGRVPAAGVPRDWA
jgi:energy-coupling factor transporter ATP-binding protein EcfA2